MKQMLSWLVVLTFHATASASVLLNVEQFDNRDTWSGYTTLSDVSLGIEAKENYFSEESANFLVGGDSAEAVNLYEITTVSRAQHSETDVSSHGVCWCPLALNSASWTNEGENIQVGIFLTSVTGAGAPPGEDVVPEPCSLALFGTAFLPLIVGGFVRRRRSTQ